MTVLIDSSAWIEFLRGSKISGEIELILFSNDEIILSAVNVAEVYKYVLSNYTVTEADDVMKFMLQRGFVIPVTVEIAKEAAKLRHKRDLSLGDAFIMATAHVHSAKILTCDKDFKKEPDVIYLSSK